MSVSNNMRQPARRGLLIGIDRYPLIPGRDLQGCVADVEDLFQILTTRFQFPNENLCILRNEQATRDGILNALDLLAQQTEPNDIVVIQYSGHGGQVLDLGGDEGDGLDETLVPSDSGRDPHPNRDILDDELHVRFTAIAAKTPSLTIIHDCCHSGTGSRDLFAAASRGLPADLRRGASLPPYAAGGGLHAPNSRSVSLNKGYAYIAACTDAQEAKEYSSRQGDGSRTHGALSYFLQRELCAASGTDSLRRVFERAQRQVSALFPIQQPRAEGTLDRAVFGKEELPDKEWVGVRERVGKLITLSIGQLHGATVGSTYQVFAQQGPTEPTDALGEIKVERVYATTSQALVQKEATPGRIQVPCRARETLHVLEDPTLRLEVVAGGPQHADDVNKLVAALKQKSCVRVVANEPADYRIYAIPQREAADADDIMPALGQLKEPIWAVINRCGDLAMPAIRLTEAPSIDALANAVTLLARQRALLMLENPRAKSALRGKVTVQILLHRDSQLIPLTADDSGQIRLTEGQAIAVRVFNGSTVPVYPFVFYVPIEGTDAGITNVIPENNWSERLEPGHQISCGAEPDQAIQIEIPAELAQPGRSRPGGKLGGTAYLKLIAIDHDANLVPIVCQPSPSAGLVHAGLVANQDGANNGTRNLQLSKDQSEDFACETVALFLCKPDSTQS